MCDNFDDPSDKQKIVDNLIFCCLVGLSTPLRDGVKETVEACATAGINTRVATGD